MPKNKINTAAPPVDVPRLVRQFPILSAHLWIPAEYPPTRSGTYLVLFACGPEFTAADWYPKSGWSPDAGDEDTITHWMPMPVSLPNEQGEARPHQQPESEDHE